MALKESNMLPLGTTAPDFTLPDTVSGQLVHAHQEMNDRISVIMFLCNHCPYVIHVNAQIVALAKEYQEQGVRFLAISSNDVINYPQDGPDLMKTTAQEAGYSFPYLYDETQEVARAYDAACTPDFYVFGPDMKLTYRGRLDSSRPGNDQPLNGADLRHALDALLDDKPAPEPQYPSAGCNIKWKS